MLFLGLLGIVATVALPGALLLCILGGEAGSRAERSVYGFGLSLFLNHWILCALVLLGINRQPVWLTIVAAEAGLAIWFWSRCRFRSAHLVLAPAEAPLLTESPAPGWAAFLATAAISTALVFAGIFFSNCGRVFYSNDEVALWNRFATEWFSNQFPTVTKLYTQLLPANFSVVYSVLGTSELQLFARAIMPLFPAAMVVLLLGRGVRTRSLGHVAGATLCGAGLLAWLGPEFLGWGNADLPVALYALLAFHVLDEQDPDDRRKLLAIVFGCAASVAKQSGLLVLGMVCLYLAWITWRRGQASRLLWAWWLRWGAVAVLPVACWYGYKFVQIARGEESTMLGALTEDVHHGGRNAVERIGHAAGLLIHSAEGGLSFVALGICLLALAGFAFRRQRAILLLVLPWFLIWGEFFSYDIRNASMLFPFLALAAGQTADGIARRMERRSAGWAGLVGACLAALLGAGLWRSGSLYGWPLAVAGILVVVWIAIPRRRLVSVPWPVPAVLAVVLLVPLSFGKYSARAMLEDQRRQGRAIGLESINQRLYGLGISQPVLTNYWYFHALPDMKQYNRFLLCGRTCTAGDILERVDRYRDTGYLLFVKNLLRPEAAHELPDCPGLETVFVEGSVRLFRIDRATFRPDPSGCVATAPVIEGLYPAETPAGVGFNVQANGVSAIAVACHHHTPSTVVVWNGRTLDTVASDRLISAGVPKELYRRRGLVIVELLDPASGLRSKPAEFRVR